MNDNEQCKKDDNQSELRDDDQGADRDALELLPIWKATARPSLVAQGIAFSTNNAKEGCIY